MFMSVKCAYASIQTQTSQSIILNGLGQGSPIGVILSAICPQNKMYNQSNKITYIPDIQDYLHKELSADTTLGPFRTDSFPDLHRVGVITKTPIWEMAANYRSLHSGGFKCK